MNKLISFLFIIFLSGCSLNSNSKFWSSEEKVSQDISISEKYLKKDLLKKENVFKKEFNKNLKINLNDQTEFNQVSINYSNNNGVSNFNGNLKNSKIRLETIMTIIFLRKQIQY